MSSLTVLITNHSLQDPAGSEMYVFDLARKLLEFGHRPVVYSQRHGQVANRLLQATVPVVADLDRIGIQPDILHCHHSLASSAALLKFPGVPATYVCHDWAWHHDSPPKLSRMPKVVAVDCTVAERLMTREGRSPDEIVLLHNGVDLDRFRLRDSLPRQPRRALVFSNYMTSEHASIVQAACEKHGIQLDAIGRQFGNCVESPADIFHQYDLVFAKGRSAWEALATGAAVVVCDVRGIGGMVTLDRLHNQMPRNFGRRLLSTPLNCDNVALEIEQYLAGDALAVSDRIRDAADLNKTVGRLLELYQTIIRMSQEIVCDPSEELEEFSRMLAYCDRSRSLWQTNFETSHQISLQHRPAGPHGFSATGAALRAA